ncbi:MAG: hypothetical protein PVI86_14800 [Phycisphaerae bacterium]|jgi:hypothetical protein
MRHKKPNLKMWLAFVVLFSCGVPPALGNSRSCRGPQQFETTEVFRCVSETGLVRLGLLPGTASDTAYAGTGEGQITPEVYGKNAVLWTENGVEGMPSNGSLVARADLIPLGRREVRLDLIPGPVAVLILAMGCLLVRCRRMVNPGLALAIGSCLFLSALTASVNGPRVRGAR